ncbi:MAG: hypothetical protein GY858_04710 [Candidatus Omnitrophica bacterium]|nr:hypothetical protein [Candidatus Omnitrophota bacterium]
MRLYNELRGSITPYERFIYKAVVFLRREGRKGEFSSLAEALDMNNGDLEGVFVRLYRDLHFAGPDDTQVNDTELNMIFGLIGKSEYSFNIANPAFFRLLDVFENLIEEKSIDRRELFKNLKQLLGGLPQAPLKSDSDQVVALGDQEIMSPLSAHSFLSTWAIALALEIDLLLADQQADAIKTALDYGNIVGFTPDQIAKLKEGQSILRLSDSQLVKEEVVHVSEDAGLSIKPQRILSLNQKAQPTLALEEEYHKVCGILTAQERFVYKMRDLEINESKNTFDSIDEFLGTEEKTAKKLYELALDKINFAKGTHPNLLPETFEGRYDIAFGTDSQLVLFRKSTLFFDWIAQVEVESRKNDKLNEESIRGIIHKAASEIKNNLPRFPDKETQGMFFQEEKIPLDAAYHDFLLLSLAKNVSGDLDAKVPTNINRFRELSRLSEKYDYLAGLSASEMKSLLDQAESVKNETGYALEKIRRYSMFYNFLCKEFKVDLSNPRLCRVLEAAAFYIALHDEDREGAILRRIFPIRDGLGALSSEIVSNEQKIRLAWKAVVLNFDEYEVSERIVKRILNKEKSAEELLDELNFSAFYALTIASDTENYFDPQFGRWEKFSRILKEVSNAKSDHPSFLFIFKYLNGVNSRKMTPEEVGAFLGLSGSRVNHIYKFRILEKIKGIVEGHKIPDKPSLDSDLARTLAFGFDIWPLGTPYFRFVRKLEEKVSKEGLTHGAISEIVDPELDEISFYELRDRLAATWDRGNSEAPLPLRVYTNIAVAMLCHELGIKFTVDDSKGDRTMIRNALTNPEEFFSLSEEEAKRFCLSGPGYQAKYLQKLFRIDSSEPKKVDEPTKSYKEGREVITERANGASVSKEAIDSRSEGQIKLKRDNPYMRVRKTLDRSVGDGALRASHRAADLQNPVNLISELYPKRGGILTPRQRFIAETMIAPDDTARSLDLSQEGLQQEHLEIARLLKSSKDNNEPIKNKHLILEFVFQTEVGFNATCPLFFELFAKLEEKYAALDRKDAIDKIWLAAWNLSLPQIPLAEVDSNRDDVISPIVTHSYLITLALAHKMGIELEVSGEIVAKIEEAVNLYSSLIGFTLEDAKILLNYPNLDGVSQKQIERWRKKLNPPIEAILERSLFQNLPLVDPNFPNRGIIAKKFKKVSGELSPQRRVLYRMRKGLGCDAYTIAEIAKFTGMNNTSIAGQIQTAENKIKKFSEYDPSALQPEAPYTNLPIYFATCVDNPDTGYSRYAVFRKVGFFFSLVEEVERKYIVEGGENEKDIIDRMDAAIEEIKHKIDEPPTGEENQEAGIKYMISLRVAHAYLAVLFLAEKLNIKLTRDSQVSKVEKFMLEYLSEKKATPEQVEETKKLFEPLAPRKRLGKRALVPPKKKKPSVSKTPLRKPSRRSRSATEILDSVLLQARTIRYRGDSPPMRIRKTVNRAGGIELDLSQEIGEKSVAEEKTLDTVTSKQRIIFSADEVVGITFQITRIKRQAAKSRR